MGCIYKKKKNRNISSEQFTQFEFKADSKNKLSLCPLCGLLVF